MIGHLDEVVVDCHEPMALATFWLGVLGGYVVRLSHDWVALETPPGLTIGFQAVPEPKAGKNRLHLDVEVSDLDVAVVAAEVLGAHRVGEAVDEGDGSRFQVMADPEGNEFCLVAGPPASAA